MAVEAGTEVEIRSGGVLVNPATGEALAQNADAEELAAALDSAREMEKALYAFRKRVGEEVYRRMDQSGQWSMKVGGYEVKGSSPTAGTEEWDGHDLALALGDLVMQGKINNEAAKAAVEEVVSYKPKQKGINALLKIPGVKDYIDHAKKEVERERRPPSVRKVA